MFNMCHQHECSLHATACDKYDVCSRILPRCPRCQSAARLDCLWATAPSPCLGNHGLVKFYGAKVTPRAKSARGGHRCPDAVFALRFSHEYIHITVSLLNSLRRICLFHELHYVRMSEGTLLCLHSFLLFLNWYGPGLNTSFNVMSGKLYHYQPSYQIFYNLNECRREEGRWR